MASLRRLCKETTSITHTERHPLRKGRHPERARPVPTLPGFPLEDAAWPPTFGPCPQPAGGGRRGELGLCLGPLGTLARLEAVGKALPERPFQGSGPVSRRGGRSRQPCQQAEKSLGGQQLGPGVREADGATLSSPLPRLVIQRVPPKSDRSPTGESMGLFIY